MKIVIEIATDPDAPIEVVEEEIGHIMRKVTTLAANGWREGECIDSYGNNVGHFKLIWD